MGVRHPGIIPALAGNTGRRNSDAYQIADHPRSRGEYPPAGTKHPGTAGSSPLSRGIRVGEHGRPGFARIIPALAGNTYGEVSRRSQGADHPRSRGEYRCSSRFRLESFGSSPLSRGIPGLPGMDVGYVGIIPALAGNTHRSDHKESSWEDHPRSRGEYPPWWPTRRGTTGSSPLSRGIPVPCPPLPDGPRIIPALAGNTA